ncbi:MAG: VOC family protein [Thermoanaerobaculia bacterium]|nr:VOC family protein [Thermoanaerobaculia bacterium]
MPANVPPIPEDFHSITPHLVVRGVVAAVDFYQQAFGARELFRNRAPDGESVIHSEMLLGDSRFFVNDEFPDHGVFSPREYGGTAVTLHLYVEDVDTVFQRALQAGAEVLLPLADQFWGDRYGIVADPFGHKWSLASRLEDLSPEETNRRAKEFFQENPDHDKG